MIRISLSVRMHPAWRPVLDPIRNLFASCWIAVREWGRLPMADSDMVRRTALRRADLALRQRGSADLLVILFIMALLALGHYLEQLAK